MSRLTSYVFFVLCFGFCIMVENLSVKVDKFKWDETSQILTKHVAIKNLSKILRDAILDDPTELPLALLDDKPVPRSARCKRASFLRNQRKRFGLDNGAADGRQSSFAKRMQRRVRPRAPPRITHRNKIGSIVSSKLGLPLFV